MSATRNKAALLGDPNVKPSALSVIAENIPAQLIALTQWVTWQFAWPGNGKKWSKIPFNAKTNRQASVSDPATWATFDETLALYRAGHADGIGFVLAGITGIDLDDCRDVENGVIAQRATAIIAGMDTYCEVSPTGTGVKLLLHGKLPPKGRRKGNIEMYDAGRYFTVTGHRLPDCPTLVNERQDQLDALHEQVFGSPVHKSFNVGANGAGIMDDNDLINAAMNARNGETFRRLWAGDISGYGGDHSAADLALCSLLVFWCGPNPERIDRMFRHSALFRPKWDERRGEQTYGTLTIAKALQGKTEFYTGPSPQIRNGQGAKYHADEEQPDDPFGSVTDEILDRAPQREHIGTCEPRQATEPSDFISLTDLGNGKRFAAEHGKIARYCHPWEKWLFWDGMRWHIDDMGRAMALAKKTILGLFRSAQMQSKKLADNEGPDAKAAIARIKAVLDFAFKSQHHSRLKAMIDLAKSEPGIPILPDVLDADPWVLNCINGTLDLRTGELRRHNQADYLTKLCPVAFDRAATCHRWENALSEIFDCSEALIAYMQRLCGYWLTGRTNEHALPVLYGVGANGKSTFVGTIFDVLGPDYSGKASRDLLTAIKGDKHPTALAWLQGKRFVAAIETAEGARLDEALVKELTGGDPVTARRMREDFWTFQPSHKIALVTNHKPAIKGTDHAIWRRLRLVPFTIVFPEDQQDKRLGEKLCAEGPGILNWMLTGCLIWQKHGLADPPEVLTATAEYRNAEDRLGEFLAERCRLNAEFRVKNSELFGAFREWCEANGEQWGTATAFTRALAERGISRDAGRRWYVGVAMGTEDTG